MKVEKFNIGQLQLLCAVNPASTSIAYILYPMDMLDGWVESASRRYGTSIAVLTGMDWDNDLTPWPAPGEPEGSPDFQGKAPEFLKLLTGKVIPVVEQRYKIQPGLQRSLVGVSLSGLFTLWQWPQCDMFRNIATLSGSFWYEGFARWVLTQTFTDKRGRCFMLLGAEEPYSSTPAFRRVGECTDSIVDYLHHQGVDVTYETVPGNHFQHALERLDQAFAHLYTIK